MSDRFSDLEILNQEELVVEAVKALRKILETYAELIRREEDTRSFLNDLCSFSIETMIWFILWEGGSSQRFTDILRVVGCSRSTLSDSLLELVGMGLVRMIETRYQAVSPALLVRKTEPKKRKH